jgi:hypothetical protein
LVFADWLDEHGREVSANYLRLSSELEELPATRENLPRREALESERRRLYREALREWQESPTAELLASVGTFQRLSESGLPILRPRSKEALLSSTEAQQVAILGLDLGLQNWTAPEITRLTGLNLTHVTWLDLSFNNLGPEAARALAHPDSPLKHVTTLDLSTNDLGPEGARALAHRDSPFKHVTTLDLSANFLGPEGARALAHRDSPLKHVTTLDLRVNNLGPEGARALAHRDSPLKHVTTLNLSWNRLGPEGARALAHPDSPFKRVTTLHLERNEIPDSTLAEVTRALTGR